MRDDELIELVRPYTKASDQRMRSTIEAVRLVDENDIPGDFVECGVWRGGSVMFARALSPTRKCWLFDTFTGMTMPTEQDVTRRGKPASASYEKKMRRGQKWAGVSVDEVVAYMREVGVYDPDKLEFVEGPVEETLTIPVNVPEQISVLRLDTDWHASTKIELEALYPRLQVGGVLIVDDYGHWMGARKAVDDYFGDRSPAADPGNWTQVDYTAVSMVKQC